jgi:hypothetical protein
LVCGAYIRLSHACERHPYRKRCARPALKPVRIQFSVTRVSTSIPITSYIAIHLLWAGQAMLVMGVVSEYARSELNTNIKSSSIALFSIFSSGSKRCLYIRAVQGHPSAFIHDRRRQTGPLSQSTRSITRVLVRIVRTCCRGTCRSP